MNNNPKATEPQIVDIATEKSLLYARHGVRNLSLRTLQRIKHQLRQLKEKEQDELLILYYDYSSKHKLWQYENLDPDVSYEQYIRKVNLVKIPMQRLLDAIMQRDFF